VALATMTGRAGRGLPLRFRDALPEKTLT
jgi:hypothetical protein